MSAAALALGSLPPMPAAAADAAAQQQLLTPSERGLPAQQQQLTPYERGLQQVYGLQQDGRVRPCMTDANPNCV